MFANLRLRNRILVLSTTRTDRLYVLNLLKLSMSLLQHKSYEIILKIYTHASLLQNFMKVLQNVHRTSALLNSHSLGIIIIAPVPLPSFLSHFCNLHVTVTLITLRQLQTI